MLKRLISSALALSLVFGGAAMLPEGALELDAALSASAKEYMQYGNYACIVLYDGTLEINCYSGNDVDVIIPSEIDGKKVTSIGKSAFTSCSCSSVSIPNSITNIGAEAFSCCENLKSIYLPNSITNIGIFAFAWCTSLKKITIPTGVKKIENYTFLASGLTSVVLPNNLTEIGKSAFEDCDKLTSINLPKGIKSIGESAFKDCDKLTSINLPKGIKSIGVRAFERCQKLTTITIPDSVIIINDYAFCECTGIKSMTIPKSVTSIGSSALGCKYDGLFIISREDFTIKCYSGSAAEKYAKDNGIKYELISASAAKTSIKNATVTNIKNRHYTGKALTQSPVVKVGGKTLKAGTDYTLSYKNNKAIGTATVTIKGKGKYAGSVSKTFKVCPPKTTLKSASSPAKGKLKVKYTKEKNATAYQITYSTSSSFAKSKTASKSSAKLTKTISGLKSGKTYYVKVRTYKTVNGTKYYSGYSAVKKIKVK